MSESFRRLHESGCWALPNPWDVGSARLLEHAGAVALATTSSGLAASLGRHDQHVGRDELVAHVAAICAAVSIPVNVDAERCYADDGDGIASTVDALADAGAAGLSIEDFDPARGAIDPIDVATERVAAAADAAHRRGLVLTARAENHLYDAGDLDDTLERLARFRDAGADCLYAPGLVEPADIAAVVSLGRPVNVLLRPDGPAVPELAALGVRRVSTGGRLAFVAYGALMAAARELLDAGTVTAPMLSGRDRAAFG
jgi:2-methylisocitrate lyase-like PEP mutase family enzyme